MSGRSRDALSAPNPLQVHAHTTLQGTLFWVYACTQRQPHPAHQPHCPPPTSNQASNPPPALQAACGGGSGARHPWRSICAHARSG